MTIYILSLLERSLWQEKLLKIETADFYFTPEYAELCGYVDRGESCCFVYEEGDNIFLYPFRKRSLPDYLSKHFDKIFFDITSDYGYGGPISNTPSMDFLVKANQSFCDFCRLNNIITEFVRFNPVCKNAYSFSAFYDLIPLNETVVVDLSEPGAIWRNLRKGHRTDINKSMRLGITTRLGETENDWFDFANIYLATMEALSASCYYFFSKDYFEFLRSLKSNAFLLLADYEGKPVAAACFLYDNNFLHYHLSGLLRDYANLGANKRLLLEAFERSRAMGIYKAHLGGGVGGSNTDPLMSFKSGFSDLRGQFFIAKKIHDAVAYGAICEYLLLDDLNGYFPKYRDPVVLKDFKARNKL